MEKWEFNGLGSFVARLGPGLCSILSHSTINRYAAPSPPFRSYLDYLRHGVFYWSYWLSLAIVFATGVSWITLFCLGYMILSFSYLWMGQNVMMRKRANLVAS